MHKKITLVIVAILIIIVVSAGCMGSRSPAVNPDYHGTNAKVVWEERISVGGYWATITKAAISEDNVTCYISTTGYGGGISCLRDEVKP